MQPSPPPEPPPTEPTTAPVVRSDVDAAISRAEARADRRRSEAIFAAVITFVLASMVGLAAFGMVVHRANVHDKYNRHANIAVWCGSDRSVQIDPRDGDAADAMAACQAGHGGYGP